MLSSPRAFFISFGKSRGSIICLTFYKTLLGPYFGQSPILSGDLHFFDDLQSTGGCAPLKGNELGCICVSGRGTHVSSPSMSTCCRLPCICEAHVSMPPRPPLQGDTRTSHQAVASSRQIGLITNLFRCYRTTNDFNENGAQPPESVLQFEKKVQVNFWVDK